jgi:hypothetical protein
MPSVLVDNASTFIRDGSSTSSVASSADLSTSSITRDGVSTISKVGTPISTIKVVETVITRDVPSSGSTGEMSLSYKSAEDATEDVEEPSLIKVEALSTSTDGGLLSIEEEVSIRELGNTGGGGGLDREKEKTS